MEQGDGRGESWALNTGGPSLFARLDTPHAVAYDLTGQEEPMDFLSPIVGTVTGIEMAQWRDILLFTLKVFLFTVPFVALGLFVESDVIRSSVVSRMLKSFATLLFILPILLFGILNYLAPGMPDAFWEEYPVLENFWIMEGRGAPAILSGLAVLYLTLYVAETVRGDLRD